MTASRTAARRRAIRSLLEGRVVSSQRQLVELLADRGHRVTQSTVSRDLDALGAVKVESGRSARYVPGGSDPENQARQGLTEALDEFALTVESSGGLVVIKTPPGAAQVVAGAIDRAGVPGVVGTVAGDDTLLVVAREGLAGRALAERIEGLGIRPQVWEEAS